MGLEIDTKFQVLNLGLDSLQKDNLLEKNKEIKIANFSQDFFGCNDFEISG